SADLRLDADFPVLNDDLEVDALVAVALAELRLHLADAGGELVVRDPVDALVVAASRADVALVEASPARVLRALGFRLGLAEGGRDGLAGRFGRRARRRRGGRLRSGGGRLRRARGRGRLLLRPEREGGERAQRGLLRGRRRRRGLELLEHARDLVLDHVAQGDLFVEVELVGLGARPRRRRAPRAVGAPDVALVGALLDLARDATPVREVDGVARGELLQPEEIGRA